MSTYRERRERRMERRLEWAQSRAAKSEAARQASHDATAGIPFGQPILSGHHSEKRHRRAIERGQAAASRMVEHAQMAEHHEQAAQTIARQLETSIYDDDPDAIERLAAKLADLEARRDRIKAYNASARKAAKTGGTGDTSLLDDEQREDLLTTARVCAYQLGPGAAMPSYVLSNLAGNIKRTRDRLARLTA